MGKCVIKLKCQWLIKLCGDFVRQANRPAFQALGKDVVNSPLIKGLLKNAGLPNCSVFLGEHL